MYPLSYSVTEGASGDLWKHRVERVEEDRVVEVEDGGIHQCDEDKERPLVPQTNGIVLTSPQAATEMKVKPSDYY